ncbi:hypothetical protein ABIA27_002141 [Sinorhizobium fredii]
MGDPVCAGFCDLATMMMPTSETRRPTAIAKDKGSPNINQAQIIVTGGLRYRIAVTRAGDDFLSAI